MRYTFFSGLVCCLIVLISGSFHPKDIPNPNESKETAAVCGRSGVLQSAICDPKNYMSKESRDVIEGYINAISNIAQIGVVVVDQMSSAFIKFRTIEAATEDFAIQVHNTWGVGDKESNNGALIFLSIKDRSCFISRGPGLVKKLKDRIVDEVIDSMKPYLRKQEYGKAIEHCVVEMNLLLSGKRKVYFPDSSIHSSSYSSSSSSPPPEELSWWESILEFWPFGIFLGFIGYSIYQARNLSRMERGKVAFDKFMKDLKDAKDGNKFKATSCPICMEDFPVETTTTTTTPAQDILKGATASAAAATVTEEAKESAACVSTSSAHMSSSLSSPATSSSASSAAETEVKDKTSDKKKDDDISSSINNNISNTTSKNPLRPMSLRCGHAFCYTCLTDHFKKSPNNMICPICREPIDGSQGPRPPKTTGSSGGRGDTRHPRPGSGLSSSSSSSSFTTTNDRPSCAESMAAQETLDLRDLPTYQSDYSSTSSDSSTSTATADTSSSSSSSSTSNANGSWFRSRTAPSTSSITYQTYQPRRSRLDWLEWNYRLNRMRYLYPNVIDNQSYRAMSSAIENQNIDAFLQSSELRQVAVQRIITNAKTRAAAAQSGSSGSGFRFGGGRSSGGRGGRW